MNYLKHSDGRTPKQTKAEPQQQPKVEKPGRMGGPSDYGRFYWCVKTELSQSGEIYVFADEVQFTPTGSVLFLGRRDEPGEDRTNLALSVGQWSAIYAASCLDGHAVAVEHWKGEIQR